MDHNMIHQQVDLLKQVLSTLGEGQELRLVTIHMALADAYVKLGDVAQSLEQFYLAAQYNQHLTAEQIKCSPLPNEFIMEIINYGVCIYNLGEAHVHDAEKIYQFALSLIKKTSDMLLFEAGSADYNWGVTCVEHGKLEEAYLHFHSADNALATLRILPNYTSIEYYKMIYYLNSYNLAHCCEKLLRFDEARVFFIQAINIQYTLSERDNIDLLQTIFRLEHMYLKLNQRNLAQQVLDEIEELISESAPLPADISYNLSYFKCAILMQGNQNRKALDLIYNCYKQMDGSPMAPNLYYQFLVVEYWACLDLRHTDRCFEILDQFLSLNDSRPGLVFADLKDIHKMRAEILDEVGRAEESLREFQFAQEEYEKSQNKDIFFEISLLTNWALACIHSFRYGEAKRIGKRCTAVVDKLKLDSRQYNFVFIPIFLNLGLVYMRLMELDLAETYLFMALNLCKKSALETGTQKDELLATLNLAWLYLSPRQLDRAEFYARSAADLISEETEYDFTQQKKEVYQILAVISSLQDRPEEGLKWIDLAIQMEEQPSISFCRSICLKGLIVKKIDPTQTNKLLTNALGMAARLHLKGSDMYLGLLMNHLNNCDELSEEIVDEFKLLIEENDFPDSYYKLIAYQNIVRYSIKLNRYSDIFEYTTRAIMIFNKLAKDAAEHKNLINIINYKQSMQFFYEILFSFLYRAGNGEINSPQLMPLLELISYYKIGDYYILRHICQETPSAQNDESQKIELQLNYLNYLSEHIKHFVDRKQEQELFLKKFDQFYWSEKLPRDTAQNRKPANSMPDIYQDFWCVDYILPEFDPSGADPHGFAIVWPLCAPEKKRIVELESVAHIKAGIEGFRAAILEDDSTLEQEIALYQILIEPLVCQEPQIREARNLIICPDGVIATIPFDVIIGTECRILYIPFLELLFSNSSETTRLAAVGGTPLLSEKNPFGVSALRASAQECGQVSKVLSNTGYTITAFNGQGENGSLPFKKEDFLKCLSSQHYALIHLSTHGFYNTKTQIADWTILNSQQDHPYRNCGLLFNDCLVDEQYSSAQSILYGEDILQTDMTGTKLVVLSSCVSGLGDMASGDWLFGLQRAFFVAGVENIVVSLWDVDEESTSILMRFFYQFLNSGLQIDIALQRAKDELRRYGDGIYNTPYYWAGFIYIGKICTL